MSVVAWRCAVLTATAALGCGGIATAGHGNTPPADLAVNGDPSAGASATMGPPMIVMPGMQPVVGATTGRSVEPSGPPGLVTFSDAGLDSTEAYSVTLTMTTFAVPAGGEVFKCQDFANPFRGQAVDIAQYDLAMSPGSHHMLLFDTSGASDGPVIDCPQGGLQLEPSTFGSQSPMKTQKYPPGIGAAVPAGMGFTMDAHYINAGASPLQANVQVTMYVAQAGLVTQHAGSLGFILTSISIPAGGQPATVSGSCAVSQDLNFLSTSSHMHQRATHFVATSSSMTLFQTDVWSDPPSTIFSPPLFLAANSVIDWSCTYINNTNSTISFGPSALTDAMCNFNGTFYPVQDVNNPSMNCLK